MQQLKKIDMVKKFADKDQVSLDDTNSEHDS